MVVLSKKGTDCVIALESALVLHGFTTATPHALWIAIRRGTRKPATDFPMEVLRVSNSAYANGIETILVDNIPVRVPVQFDVGIGDAITPPPRKCRYPVLLSGDAPCLKVYPRETVIAEKFETLVKRGLANSRMKDYYDLWHLSRDTNVNPSIAKQDVARTFARRKTPLPQTIPDGLSDAFGLNASKIVQWKAFLRKNRLTVNQPPRIVADVTAKIKAKSPNGNWKNYRTENRKITEQL